jgi:hypothetical protein
VGKRSRLEATPGTMEPAGIFAGQRMKNGTCTPPSK